MNLKIKMLHADSQVRKATDGSAGMDLYARTEETLYIYPNTTELVKTGIAIHIDNPEYAGFIMARSGLALKKGLAPANKVGLIDSDYQGEIMVALHNHSNKMTHINHGDRIAQLVIMPVVNFSLMRVDNFEPTERGAGGFGSTGEN
jgi:dUTP pyrophosphatase